MSEKDDDDPKNQKFYICVCIYKYLIRKECHVKNNRLAILQMILEDWDLGETKRYNDG